MTEQSEVIEDTPQEQEPMIPQSKVNEIVGKVRKEAHEKALIDAQAKLTPSTATMHNNGASVGMGGMPNLSEDQVQALIDKAEQARNERYQESLINEQAAKIGNHLKQRFEDGEKNIPGFKELTQNVNLPAMADVLGLLYEHANGFEEHALHELLSHPQKLGNLMSLQKVAPGVAVNMVKELSQSIRNNRSALNAEQPPEPLSQAQPSAVSTADNGKAAVRDLRSNKSYRW